MQFESTFLAEFVSHWLHVLLSIFWFGSVMFSDFILAPGLATMSAGAQKEFGASVGSRVSGTMSKVAIAVIVLGVLRGTVWGDVHSVDDLWTAYGIAFLVSLAVGVALAAWGELVTSVRIRRVQAAAPDQAPALMASVMRAAMVELALFVVAFTAMIVMHFA